MTTAPIEKPRHRSYTELDSVVAPLWAPKEGTVQPDRASAASGSATKRRTRRHRRVRTVTPCGGRVGDSTSRHYSKISSRPVVNRVEVRSRNGFRRTNRGGRTAVVAEPKRCDDDAELAVGVGGLGLGGGRRLVGRGVGGLGLLEPLLELGLGRTEVLRQLGNGRAPEDEDRHDNDNDQEIGPKNFA